MRSLIAILVIAVGSPLVPSPAEAGDATSAKYVLRGAGLSAGAVVAAEAPGGRSSGFVLGRTVTPRPSAAFSGLTTLAPGFWPIVQGDYPSLDIDGDGAPAFLDSDDDGDGLLDTVETGTGVFVSSADIGTSSVLADSDADGFEDGEEAAVGSDPNDPFSTPAVPTPVPALPGLMPGLLFLGLWLSAYSESRRRLRGRGTRQGANRRRSSS